MLNKDNIVKIHKYTDFVLKFMWDTVLDTKQSLPLTYPGHRRTHYSNSDTLYLYIYILYYIYYTL